MIFQDLNKLADKEATKDAAFKNMVGFGRDTDMTAEESFLAAHEFKNMYQQPAIFDIANNRPATDSIHVPDQGHWDRAQTYAIAQLDSKYASVEVHDSEIFEARVASLNNLAQGDAAQQVLHLKLIEHWEANNSQGEPYTPPEILDAAYCAIRQSTLYYFRHIL